MSVRTIQGITPDRGADVIRCDKCGIEAVLADMRHFGEVISFPATWRNMPFVSVDSPRVNYCPDCAVDVE